MIVRTIAAIHAPHPRAHSRFLTPGFIAFSFCRNLFDKINHSSGQIIQAVKR
jgi:hypothetical protein